MIRTTENDGTGVEAAQTSRRASGGDASLAPRDCSLSICLHCGNPLARGCDEPFCCVGCRTVYEALRSGDLLQYYDLRAGAAQPVGDLHLERRDHKWTARHQQVLRDHSGTYRVSLRVQGLQCAACVWLIERLFHRQRGARGIVVNSGQGLLALSVEQPFDFGRFVREVERLGYLVADPVDGATEPAELDTLLLRAAITTAFALNAMMFAVGIYLGMEKGPLRDFLHSVNFGLSALSVVIGAPVFVQSAFRSLRSGVLHLDLPIALGITLTFAAATWAFLTGTEQAAYYDSLSVFIALMLWGRYLQDRVVLKNRRHLLEHQPDGALITRRMGPGGWEDVPSVRLRVGDRMLIPPGDIVPVAAVLDDVSAMFSLDWINGEPEPESFDRASRIPAGAVNVGTSAAWVTALEDYEHSPIKILLTQPVLRKGEGDQVSGRFSPYYVLVVIAAAATGFVRAFLAHDSISMGLEVATAVCVVSCPCSIGLALPLAQEVVQSKLRRLGLFVRDPSFLRRAATVEAVAFDKTGTLTTGHLQLENPEAVARLPEEDRHALLAMVVGSHHPHAQAVLRAIRSQVLNAQLDVKTAPVGIEVPGQGMQLSNRGHDYRLGRASFAYSSFRAGDSQHDTVLSRDGALLATFRMREITRDDAQEECRKLREAGYRLYLASGDSEPRVTAMAQSLGVDTRRAYSSQTPEDKAALMDLPEHQRTLMLGDGINDTLALSHAYASGTPSLDRPAVTTRADFYYLTPGLRPVRAALLAARDFAAMTRRAWLFFAAYNVLVVAVAIMGRIEPFTAAIVMPLSSIVSVAYVVTTLNRRSAAWTS